MENAAQVSDQAKTKLLRELVTEHKCVYILPPEEVTVLLNKSEWSDTKNKCDG